MVGNPFQNPALRNLLHMVGPLLFGYCMVYVNQQVDKILVSGLGNGVITALTYGSTLFLWCPPLFVLSALFCSLMSRRAFPEGNTNRPLIRLFIASAYWFWSFFRSACSLFYAHTISFPSFLDTEHFMRRLWSPHPPPCGDMPLPLSLWFARGVQPFPIWLPGFQMALY